MPETVTILEATAEANHHMAVQKATQLWKEKVGTMIPEKPGYLSEKNFRSEFLLIFKFCDQVSKVCLRKIYDLDFLEFLSYLTI